MLENLFWQSISGAGNSSTSAKQEDGAGATLFRAHRHIHALGIAALTGTHKHTRRPRRRRRRSRVFTRNCSFGKASHQGLEICAKGLRMGSWEERECSNSREGSKCSCLKVTLGKWPKAMQCYHWICDDVSVWNLRWQLIGALGRFWPEMRLFWKLLVTHPNCGRFRKIKSDKWRQFPPKDQNIQK